MGCHTSKANKIEDKINQVMTMYQQILNDVREQRQKYLGKCGDIEEDDDQSQFGDLIADFEYSKKPAQQPSNNISALHNNSMSHKSTVIFTSKKSLEQAEIQRKSTLKADVWRFSNNGPDNQPENNNQKGFPHKIIITNDEFVLYMNFLKDTKQKFDRVKQKQSALIESYYNAEREDSEVELKRYHLKIEKAQKRSREVERCLNKILNQEQFTNLPDGYVVVNHY